MNKTLAQYIEHEARKVSLCLRGQIAADINDRTPIDPGDWSRREKYRMIQDGDAQLKQFTIKKIDNQSSCGKIGLLDAFTYPVPERRKKFLQINKTLQTEKATRELALEQNLNRAVSKAILEITTTAEFLLELEHIGTQEW